MDRSAISRDPLDENATAFRLRDLAEDGAITREQAEGLERALREQLPWRVWTERLLTIVGALLLLAGAVFFFAHNWQAIRPWQKFAIIETAFVGMAVLTWWRGFEDFVGKIALVAACSLVGVFLAVFGQIYQTGADSYTLFLTWAALIMPWVIMGRVHVLWLLWLVLLNVSICFSWEQIGLWPALHVKEFSELIAVLAFVNALALAGRELAARRAWSGLQAPWLRPILALAVGLAVTITNLSWIFRSWDEPRHPWPLATLALLVLGYFVYRRLLLSLACLAIIVSSFTTLAAAKTGIFLGDVVMGYSAPLLIALMVLAFYGAVVFWLKWEARVLGEHRRNQP